MRKAVAALLPVAIICIAGGCSGKLDSKSRSSETATSSADLKPESTAANDQDRGSTAATPTDQAQTGPDVKITQDVQQAIMADTALAATAPNVKVITVSGVVTLSGPVKTPQEKQLVADKAQQVAGVIRVDNQLDVMPIR
jgi:osmotically-inducible protein OsmY